MKFTTQLIATMALAFALELFLPWYCIALAAFACGYLLKSNANFLAGFFAIGLLWLLKAWMMDANASADLADRVALIFPVQKKVWLLLLTASLGALVGGFAALSGALLKPKRRYKY